MHLPPQDTSLSFTFASNVLPTYQTGILSYKDILSVEPAKYSMAGSVQPLTHQLNLLKVERWHDNSLHPTHPDRTMQSCMIP